jgi:hypothetical protein
MFTSVLKIRRYFIEKDAASQINTTMLIIHSSAFLLYLLTTIGHFTAASIWVHTANPDLYKWVALSGIFYNVGSFISQVLLCNIFWHIGKKDDAYDDDLLLARETLKV